MRLAQRLLRLTRMPIDRPSTRLVPPRTTVLAAAICLLFQATPAWLIAWRSGDAAMPARVAVSLEGPLGLSGRQLLSATPQPFVAFVLSTTALIPFLLLLLWETSSEPWPARPAVPRPARTWTTWAALQLISVSVLALLLCVRAPHAQDITGWSLRIGGWAAASGVIWTAALSLLARFIRRRFWRVVAWLCLTFSLLVVDTLWTTQPAPLLPPAVTRSLLSGSRALACCVALCWVAIAWAASRRVKAAPSGETSGG